MREHNNILQGQLSSPNASGQAEAVAAVGYENMSRQEIITRSRELKSKLSAIEAQETELMAQIESLALALPNFTSEETPRGTVPRVVGYINEHPEPAPDQSDRVWRSHVHIGSELKLLDFASAATSSGWGWYYLLNEAALLEQALVQYAISVAMKHGWRLVSPPSVVYSHVAAACGFMPRDNNGETQIYTLAQSDADRERGRPELCLAGTAEIPLAGMCANTTLEESELPRKHIAVSRCYRAEAGARGVDTKGLYRVHEFTKVELFAWTLPDLEASTAVFDEILSIQTHILGSLGLHCRILEMPATDLGASAYRKKDIEAFFPSRRPRDDGYGEVTSASVCTDYQARRLGTKVKVRTGKGKDWVHTVNGTGMAVPRVLAAVLESGWDEETGSVKIPECLWPWMGGVKRIEAKLPPVS